jgi:hypothetical protein
MIKGLCDTTAPPQRQFAHRHVIACHLDEATLRAMEPVITIEPDAPPTRTTPAEAEAAQTP